MQSAKTKKGESVSNYRPSAQSFAEDGSCAGGARRQSGAEEGEDAARRPMWGRSSSPTSKEELLENASPPVPPPEGSPPGSAPVDAVKPLKLGKSASRLALLRKQAT